MQKNTGRVLLCLLLVYAAWGSCFIGIRVALESFPAFILCGIRMMLAGILLYLITWLKGERISPDWGDFKQLNFLALLVVTISSGFLSKGQESVPSGLAAVMFGSIPIWMLLMGWLLYKEEKPGTMQIAGLLLGFFSLVALNIHQGIQGSVSPTGLLWLMGALLAWVCGSYYTKHHSADTKLSVFRSSAVTMLFGGTQALLVGLLFGERVNILEVSLTGWGTMMFLVIMSSIVGYSCYFWLLVHVRTAVAISYEYVNPVIGIFLGWLIAGETVDTATIACCAIMVSSVFLLIVQRKD